MLHIHRPNIGIGYGLLDGLFDFTDIVNQPIDIHVAAQQHFVTYNDAFDDIGVLVR